MTTGPSRPGPAPPALNGASGRNPADSKTADATQTNAEPKKSPKGETSLATPTGGKPGRQRLAALEDPDIRQQARRYVKDYDGGGCFYVAPTKLTKSAAAIDGFSQSAEKFRDFDQSFKDALGVEASITGQHIWSAQCPAVDFLQRVRSVEEDPPVLTLDRTELHSGERLSGSIENIRDRVVDLYLVSETGVVQDISPLLRQANGKKLFKLFMVYDQPGGPFPQMLVVVTAREPLPKTADGAPMAADAFFPEIVEQMKAGRGTVRATAKLFLLSR